MTIGVIGGSGIYEALPLENVEKRHVDTPFGDPSHELTLGELAGEEVAFLPRHGPDHQHTPTNAPYKANIYALKSVGVDRVVSTNAVGSLREDLPPRSLLVPTQIVDRTSRREHTFFGDGMVVHMGFADPYDPAMVEHLAGAAERADVDVESGGTYVCIEGPQYSTRAESEFYRDQGWDVVGMTAIPEAKLAREAELAYATVTGVTDYDVWKTDSEVTLDEVLENADANQESINAIIEEAVRSMPDDFESDAWSALEGTVNTPSDAIPADTRERVDLLAGQYLD
ncbi:S-methyl-5'-thioadenosine phosphorylase [Haloarchaeobius sp. HRN-SO-5]|uniref:S-methyl-5'-thioadenosine phosphorylase n=1 Tax=Haloarchaeobius sp. HRN-SO-5 TaxID=3446118 RepID=UPI003EBD644C